MVQEEEKLSLNPLFALDDAGKTQSVLLSIEEYEALLARIEYLRQEVEKARTEYEARETSDPNFPACFRT